MKKLLTGILLVSLASWCGAVEKRGRGYSGQEMFIHNLALSAGFGVGVPLGDFGDSQFGNAEAGGIGNFELEYYFAESFSLGFRFSGGLFQDDDDQDFTNRVSNYQVFGKFLVPVEGKVRPYGRFSLGLSTITYRVENFLNLGTLTSVSDPGFSLGLDGGVVWRVSNLISLNAGLGFDVAFLEDSEVENSGLNVGYDPSYFSVNFGLSFYLRP
jgi:hypothetical protein